MHFSRNAFTLIELLVVIAIIAILSVVVILTLNPAELLRQSRDANRLSDLGTLNSSLNLYSTDQSSATNFSMGSTSTVYVSIPDPSATSTAGDQCQGLGLPTLSTSTGWVYHCAASSTYKMTNGTGWIPVNFSNITSGAPFGTLPVDNVNQSSSNLYYTYMTDGTKYAVTAALESQKYLKQYLLNTNSDPVRYALGSNLSLISPSEGLVGYWPLTEGNNSTTYDQSGNTNNGMWFGTASGTNGYYTTNAKVGSYAAYFNGANNYIQSALVLNENTTFSYSLWVYIPSTSLNAAFLINGQSVSQTPPAQNGVAVGVGSEGTGGTFYSTGNQLIVVSANVFWQPTGVDIGTGWHYIVVTRDGTTMRAYLDGVQTPTLTHSTSTVVAPLANTTLGSSDNGTPLSGSRFFTGFMNDVRIYNRALSLAEIQAMYNAER